LFVFAHSPSLASSPEFLEIYNEFQEYKKGSAPDEHAAPTRYVQEQYPCISEILGRDRFEKWAEKARLEEIQHIHVIQERSIWKDEQGQLVQWDCTSNSYLVYSYFFHDNKHHYYVLEFYKFAAHKKYEHAVPCFINEAKTYRESITLANPIK